MCIPFQAGSRAASPDEEHQSSFSTDEHNSQCDSSQECSEPEKPEESSSENDSELNENQQHNVC